MSTTVTSTATFGMDAFASLAVVPSANDTRGTITFTSAAPNSDRPSFTAKLQAKEFGPFLVPMSVSIVVEDGSCTYQLTGNTGGYSYDSSDNVTGLVGPDGRQAGWSKSLFHPPALGTDPFGQNISSTNIGTVVGQTSSVVTLTDVQTTDGSGVRAVCGTADKYIELQFVLPYPMLIKQLGALVSANPATQSTLSMYAGTDSGYSTFISRGCVVNNAGAKDGYYTNGLQSIKLGGPTPTDAWTNASTLDLDTQLFTHIKIRCTPLAGQFADFTMVRWIANPSSKSRIAITIDDGYTSAYTYAAPLLQSRGLVASFAVIPDLIGTAGYMTLAQLLELQAAGHEIITHGPIGGSGSLTDNYANATLAVADAVASRQSLVDLGLITTAAEYCSYIWPQGSYQFSNGDTSLLDAMQSAGFTNARVVHRSVSYSHGAAKATVYGGMVAPIFGHVRSTSTSGAEDTEITNCTTAISYAAANGLDAVGMFHKFIADQGVFAVTDTLEIEVSRFITIIDAIVTQIAAGKARNVLFSNFSGK